MEEVIEWVRGKDNSMVIEIDVAGHAMVMVQAKTGFGPDLPSALVALAEKVKEKR